MYMMNTAFLLSGHWYPITPVSFAVYAKECNLFVVIFLYFLIRLSIGVSPYITKKSAMDDNNFDINVFI